MRPQDTLGVQIPTVELPRDGVELRRWAVVACDQYTSEPEYWQAVQQEVGEAPSTLNLIYPEVHLEEPDPAARIGRIQATMREYLERGVLQPHEGMVCVERRVDGRTRHGMLLCLDLEHYDFSRDSTSLIRPTEGTIVERIAPRLKVRDGAALEVPHILVLIDDPQQRVVEPVVRAKPGLATLYRSALMQGGGEVAGFAVPPALAEGVLDGLAALARPEAFAARYGVGAERPVLLFAVGDGNHSLATAKALWERLKPSVGPDHPARYALVEVENIHDAGIVFAPIHRLLFGLRQDLPAALRASLPTPLEITPLGDVAALAEAVGAERPGTLAFGLVDENGQASVVRYADRSGTLVIAALQPCIDAFMAAGGAARLDYVHGDEALCRLAARPGNAGLFLPPIRKSDFFRTVILGGPLPRKTFSMGEAHEKRFYVEARRIR